MTIKFRCPQCGSAKHRQTKSYFICLECGLKFLKDSYSKFQQDAISLEEAEGIKEGLEEAFGDIPWEEIKKDLEKL